ncbi:MAG: hypothetical protein KDA22_07450, partial [Phycisphaerales bacterium]|nr:hypothetical protein [Phycisphaerales bacterium]
MRRSGWLLVGPGMLVWLAAVAIPAVALAIAGAAGAVAEDGPGMRHALGLLGITLAWAFWVAVPAVLLGWVPGRLLHAALAGAGSRSALAAPAIVLALLVPVFLPANLAYFAWWQVLGPDGAMGAWMIRHDLVAPARQLVLWLALVCWAWPLAAWCVAAGCGASAETAWALRLDGAGRRARLRTALLEDRAGLGLAVSIVVLFTLGNTSAFDLAQVRSIGFEIRTLDTQGASPAELLRSAWPAVAAALALAAFAWRAVGRIAVHPIGAPPPRGRGSLAAVAAIVLATVVLPTALLLGRLGTESRWGEFLSLYGPAAANTLATSAGAAAAGALIGLGTAAARLGGGRAVRFGSSATGTTLLLAGAIPGTLVAAGVAAAYNRDMSGPLIYDTPVAVVLGLVACFGFVAACIGRLAAAGEPRTLADARRMDGVSTAGALLRTAGPRLLAAGGSSAAVVFALSMSEVIVSARLQPPGWDALAASMLNAMHYQHTETVMHAVVVLLGMAIVGAM